MSGCGRVCICVRECVCISWGWGVSWQIVRNFASFRGNVLLPQTGDRGLVVIQSGQTDKYGMRQKETVKGRPSSGFYVGFMWQQHILGKRSEFLLLSLSHSLSLFRLSFLADEEANPFTQLSLADNNMCCLEGERARHHKSNHLVNCPLKSQLFHLPSGRAVYICVCLRGDILLSKQNFKPHTSSFRAIKSSFTTF